jgi:hypothetical protein
MRRGVLHRSPGLVRAIAQFEFGSQTSESLCAAREWLADRRGWSGAAVLDVLLERLHPRIAVEKSPDNVFDDVSLRRMDAAYPKARYLHLTRHPITTQRSLDAHLRLTLPSYPRDGEPMAGIASWYEIHRRILLFGADLPECRYLRVRAEDVLNETTSQLQMISEWLRVRSDKDAITAMQHPEASPFARALPQRAAFQAGPTQISCVIQFHVE